MALITKNKKAYFDYTILDTLEAGIVLSGDEVKSIRAGHMSLSACYATVHQGELYLINCHITPYAKAYNKIAEKDATTRRKLLLHKRELVKLIGTISEKGVTIVALSAYFNKRNKVKIELGIAKHKNAPSKKSVLKERELGREARREMRGKDD
jgi:SsrA-binding protein